ncbi:uncharacterized protein LOC133178290 [Saccostrea echinata]|uniref:uncharacterized protein LOC133178290 n=1 Tax=Saccostrea echinata TaxID=191078 RepID=UPI002A7F94EB|nr:uncharacterized protein LOC133178290 [Saccostrea echinata]
MANECKHIKIVFLTLFCIGVYVYLYDQTSRNIDISKNILETVKQSLNTHIYIMKNDQLPSSFADSVVPPEANLMVQSESNVKLHNQKIKKKSDLRNFVGEYKRTLRKVEKLKQGEITTEFLRDKNLSFPVLTMFTTWSEDAEKYLCRNTTVVNWSTMKPLITPILFTNDTDLIIRVLNKGWNVLPVVKTGIGIPVLKDMFLAAMKLSKSSFYAFANGDILFTGGLLKTVVAVEKITNVLNNTVLIIGQRTNLPNISMQAAENFDLLRNISKHRGKLFTEWAEDYFITSANYPWMEMPDVVIGRRAYDNFLVIESLKRGFIVIDATKTILAVHHTTKSGNFENRKKGNNDYNAVLISKYYRNKIINYTKGLTKCANYNTILLSNGTITLFKKKKQNC